MIDIILAKELMRFVGLLLSLMAMITAFYKLGKMEKSHYIDTVIKNGFSALFWLVVSAVLTLEVLL